MNVFISHNKADKVNARLLAMELVGQGVSVWFDAWSIRLGDSIIGGIEEGLSKADVFVLLWSEAASKSNWVDTEVRAYLRRRVDDDELRIVPIMLDKTRFRHSLQTIGALDRTRRRDSSRSRAN